MSCRRIGKNDGRLPFSLNNMQALEVDVVNTLTANNLCVTGTATLPPATFPPATGLSHNDDTDNPTSDTHGIGATSDVVGTETTQTLLNKTLHDGYLTGGLTAFLLGDVYIDQEVVGLQKFQIRTRGGIKIESRNERIQLRAANQLILQATNPSVSALRIESENGGIFVESEKKIDIHTNDTGTDAIDINALAGGVKITGTKLINLTTTDTGNPALKLNALTGGVEIRGGTALELSTLAGDIDILPFGGVLNLSNFTQLNGAQGTSGQVLTSNGASAASWQDIPAGLTYKNVAAFNSGTNQKPYSAAATETIDRDSNAYIMSGLVPNATYILHYSYVQNQVLTSDDNNTIYLNGWDKSNTVINNVEVNDFANNDSGSLNAVSFNVPLVCSGLLAPDTQHVAYHCSGHYVTTASGGGDITFATRVQGANITVTWAAGTATYSVEANSQRLTAIYLAA